MSHQRIQSPCALSVASMMQLESFAASRSRRSIKDLINQVRLRQVNRSIQHSIYADSKEVGEVAFDCNGQLGLRLELLDDLINLRFVGTSQEAVISV